MFKDKLKLIRTKSNLSQKELANILKISPSTYCCYENGTRKPNLDIINKMISVFGDQSIELFDLPITNEVVYPNDMLDSLESVLKDYGHPGTNYIEDKRNFDKLKEELKKVLEIRDEALTFPNLNLNNVPSGTTVKIAKLDLRGEQLIDRCIKAQSLILESMSTRK